MSGILDARRVKIALLALAALIVAKSFVSGALFDKEIRLERNIYAHQADAFLHGRLDLDHYLPDSAEYDGKFHNVFPPVPSLVLMPVVALFGPEGTNGVLVAAALTVLNLFMLRRILGLLKVPADTVPWILAAFFLGTAYWVSVTAGTFSHNFAHIVAVTFMLAAIHETLGRGRGLPAGVFLTSAILSRQMVVYAVPFLCFMLWRHPRIESRVGKLVNQTFFFSSLGVGLGVYMIFNYLRFGNPLDAGYAHVIAGGMLLAREEGYGLFSPAYIPYNFIHMFLEGFHIQFRPPDYVGGIETSPFGTSITFASPFVFIALWTRLEKPVVAAACVSIVLCLMHIMVYHNNGWVQLNAQRYTLDFMPVLILLVATATERVDPKLWKGAVLYSFILNMLAIVIIPPLRHLDRVFPWFHL